MRALMLPGVIDHSHEGRRKHYATLSLLLVMLAIAAVGSLSAADGGADADLESGRFAAAAAKCRRELAVDLEDVQRLELTARLCAALRGMGKAAEGLVALDALPAGLRTCPEAELERGRCLRALGKGVEAEKVLLLLPGVEEPSLAAAAAYELAALKVEQKRYELAIDWCRRCLAIGRKGSQADEQLQVLLPKARELLATATDAFALERLGKDYQLYRQARIAQAKKDYPKAIELYGKITDNPVLREAAGCYLPACWFALDERAKAERLYRDFCYTNPFGLYRGEAKLAWARSLLLTKSGPSALESARKLLEENHRWFELTAGRNPTIELAPLTATEGKNKGVDTFDYDAIVKYFPVPEVYARAGDLAGVLREYAGPETIVNRMTCTWYLPMLQVDSLLLHAFVCAELEDASAAAASVEQALALNRAYGSVFLRNEAARGQLHAGLKQGSFLVPPREWKRFSSDHARRLRLGCFYAVAGEYASARWLFEQVAAAGKTEKLRDEERAAICYGLAVCLLGQGDRQRAAQQLAPFLDDLRRSGLAESAWLLLANLKAGEPDGAVEAQRLYLEVARKAPEPVLKAQALLSLAVMACNRGDNRLAAEACNLLVRNVPDTPQAPAARNLLDRLHAGQGVIRNGLPPADPSDIATDQGRVVRVDAHLVLPGAKKLNTDYEGLRPADLLRYTVTASPQADCIIVRGFTLSFTADEPQPVPTVGRHAQFIRAPVLFRDQLWAAPDAELVTIRVGEEGQLIFWQNQFDALLAKKQYREAAELLKGLLDDKRTHSAYRSLLTADLARVYRLDGAPDKALKLLEGLDLATRLDGRVRLEVGLARSALEQPLEAAEQLRRCLHVRDPAIQTEAAYELARLAFAAGSYEQAAKYARQAIEQGRGLSETPTASLVDAARELEVTASRDALVKTLGEPYWYYRQGQLAEQTGRWEDAIAAYEQVGAPVLADAARCNRARCLAELGEDRKAAEAYRSLLSEHPDGMYAVESRLAWARMLLIQANRPDDLREAQLLLDQALAGIDRWRQSPKVDLGAVAAMLKANPVGDKFAFPGGPNWPAPASILNPATAAWYLDYLEISASLLMGFIRTELDDWEGAQDVFRRAGERLVANGQPVEGLLLGLEEAGREGAFLVPKEALRRLSPRLRYSLHLACFYTVSGQDWLAAPLFARIERDHQRSLGRDEEGVLRLGLGACALRRGDLRLARHHLEPFEKELRQAAVAPLALFLWQAGRTRSNASAAMAENAATFIAETYGSDYLAYRQGREAEAIGEHSQALSAYAKVTSGDLADACRLGAARCLIAQGRYPTAVAALRQLARDLPGSPYAPEISQELAIAIYLEGKGSRQAVLAAYQILDDALKRLPEIDRQWDELYQRERNLPALLLLFQDDSPTARVERDFSPKEPLAVPGSKGWPGPEMVVNARTCRWYLQWMRCRLHLLRLYIALEANDGAVADQAYTAAFADLPQQDAAVEALRSAIGQAGRAKAFLVPHETWARLRQPTVRLAAFFAVVGETDRPQPLADTALAAINPSIEEQATAAVVILACRLHHEKAEAVRTLMDTLRPVIRRTGLLKPATLLTQLAL